MLLTPGGQLGVRTSWILHHRNQGLLVLQMTQEGFNLVFSLVQILCGARSMEMHIPFDPIRVSPFGMNRIVMPSHQVPHLVEKPPLS